ncbi:MAG: response regulator transcription factor [Rubricoccaceae bacterium]
MQETVRALVVDDEPDVQYLFQQKFRKEMRRGVVAFHFAQSGEEALRLLRSGAAADLMLVLSDINMPGMNGLDLLRAVKQEFPELRVHMITAYDDGQLREVALKRGAEGYVVKPIDFETLKASVFGLEPA